MLSGLYALWNSSTGYAGQRVGDTISDRSAGASARVICEGLASGLPVVAYARGS